MTVSNRSSQRRGTIVITGASSGLGAEMARQFTALGYDVGLAARRLDRLEDVRAENHARHPDRIVELASWT
ncbi:SDR family NAD(P)-dependent oxidoreductase [Nocardia xishanensis]